MNQPTPFSAINLIADCAPEFRAVVISVADRELVLEFPVPLTGGRCTTYRLKIQAGGKIANVSEVTPTHLPAFCPNRHINSDGSFCMYWWGEELLSIVDRDSAVAWLETLVRYLQDQAIAKKIRKWPFKEWAHGEAATHQSAAIKSTAALGPRFSSALDERLFSVQEGRKTIDRRGHPLRLYQAGRHIATVWKGTGKLANRKQRCPCRPKTAGQSVRIKACGSHEKNLTDLILAVMSWPVAEEKYWAWAKSTNAECCGSMDVCPLKKKD